MTGRGLTTVVIGVGNRFRRDDGAGPVLVDRLNARLAHSGCCDVRTHELDGEASRIIEAWSGAALAIVVDAARSGDEPGTLRRYDTDGAGGEGLDCAGASVAWGAASTHGLGVSEAVELAGALDRLPQRLIVYAIGGADFSEGTELSPPVGQAVEEVLDLVLVDLAHTMKDS
ncbi:MAG: hypothetical protein JJLCMIEE_03644 [Acidimicrobiales bacterium]|nr:MAG: hydrogenase maturation protease [Actinomycetota bacterium]MBV6510488.1 hypothetical protein [Acidimicrobiales bacterium]RIK07157.1 MAG: peptidase M52 [Acidobacteriota bacterium]